MIANTSYSATTYAAPCGHCRNDTHEDELQTLPHDPEGDVFCYLCREALSAPTH